MSTTAKQSTQHTPVPWEIGFKSMFKPMSAIVIYDKGLTSIARVLRNEDVNDEEQHANAALIVKAVNNHAALIEALEVLLTFDGISARDKAREVLKQAKGEL